MDFRLSGHTGLKDGESGFGRITDVNDQEVPCRVSRRGEWFTVSFEYDGWPWHGRLFNGKESELHCRPYREKRDRGRTLRRPAVRKVPLPVPEDLQQMTYRIYGDSVQRLLTELIARGWTIKPPK